MLFISVDPLLCATVLATSMLYLNHINLRVQANSKFWRGFPFRTTPQGIPSQVPRPIFYWKLGNLTRDSQPGFGLFRVMCLCI